MFVSPSHQYPTGAMMSHGRRQQLLDYAAVHGVWVVEDDYDSEFRYGARPLPALQGLDRHGRVIYLGTFSKTLFPALRLAYLVLPPDLVDRLRARAQRVVPRRARRRSRRCWRASWPRATTPATSGACAASTARAMTR